MSATDFRIIENVPDEIRLAKATGRNKRNVVLIKKEFAERCSLLNTVAEILRACITICNKRILHKALLFIRNKGKQKNSDYHKIVTIK